MVNSAPPYFFGNKGKSQPFAPNFSARPRRNLYSSSSSRVDQEADQRKCSWPLNCSVIQAVTSLRNSTTCGGSAETLKSISDSFCFVWVSSFLFRVGRPELETRNEKPIHTTPLVR